MHTYFYVEMKSCVKGELIEFYFAGLPQMYLGLLSEEEYKKYQNDMSSVSRNLCKTRAVGTIKSDGTWYAVFDLNGKQLAELQTSVRRFAPSFSKQEVSEFSASNGVSYVLNAEDTTTDKSMIQHWKDNQNKDSKINLDNKTFVCPSCCKRVNTEDLHGAHVIKVNDRSGSMYITPTCDSCNTSKTKRIFKVDSCDLVLAPQKK